MEATNISIKQQSSVSINVETLQAIIQHLWFMVKGAWLMVQGAWLRVKGSMSLPRLYLHVLRLPHAVARAIDAHPALSNIFLWVMCAACFWAVLTYNFTTHI